MQLERRNMRTLYDRTPYVRRMALENEIKSWVSSVASLSDPFNEESTRKPEAHSSALTLKQVEYFHKASVILDTPGYMTSIASRVSVFQRELVALRGSSKDKPDNERIALRERIARTLKSCRQGRMDIAAAKVVCDLYIKDIGDNAGFYNEHLDRVGMPQNNPLRPEAYCVVAPPSPEDQSEKHLFSGSSGNGIDGLHDALDHHQHDLSTVNLAETAKAHGDQGLRIVLRDEKPPSKHSKNFERAEHVMQARNELRRILDNRAKRSPDLETFVNKNKNSLPLIARALENQPQETKRICSEVTDSQNVRLACEIVSICMGMSVWTIEKAWKENKKRLMGDN